MSSISGSSDISNPSPFLVHLFYRLGGFYKPEDFAGPSLPPHITFYTWSDCSSRELAFELAAAKATALPNPAVGTRLAFQLVYPDFRGATTFNNSIPQFAVKDLGSIVIGHGGPGAESSEVMDADVAKSRSHPADKTLSDARFVVGDYISCAVLPPMSDGSVAPASNAHKEMSANLRDGRAYWGPDTRLRRLTGWRRRRDEVTEHLPRGEWRRGENLPAHTIPRFQGNHGRKWRR